MDRLNQWIGNEQTAEGIITAERANLMQAMLSRTPDFGAGDVLPPAWHWLYFHEPVRGDGLGVEGHAKLGDFLPPVSLPRRMWAGGKLTFLRPLRISEAATKRSMVESITPKDGRSGALCFVVVQHEVRAGDELCISEEQTLVYREAADPTQAPAAVRGHAAPTDRDFSRPFTPDPIALFRYSALTFNSHRIHYDVDFCRHVEGYPDLVVHGPLTATLLLDLFYHQFPKRPITSFAYRGRSPLFNPHSFTLNGKRTGEAWAADHLGRVAMTAEVGFGG